MSLIAQQIVRSRLANRYVPMSKEATEGDGKSSATGIRQMGLQFDKLDKHPRGFALATMMNKVFVGAAKTNMPSWLKPCGINTAPKI